MVLASVQFFQTSPTTTDIFVSLSESIDFVKGETVTVFAREASGDTARTQLKKEDHIFLGTVNSANAAWIESKFWVCEAGICELIYDPEATTITFSNNSHENFPFKEFGISLQFVEKYSPNIKYVNFGSLAQPDPGKELF